jgi:glutamine amidotransferase
MIVIVDYGMGNLGSVLNMLKRVGANVKSSSDPEEIRKADKLLLPGVGAFDNAIIKIKEKGLKEVLQYKALQEKIPVLGICLGMQLLTESSEEGKLPGLGWIKGKTLSFRNRIDKNLKIPHMGWNLVYKNKESFLTQDLSEDARFYFVHSFFVRCEEEKNSILKTSYGLEFDSAIQHENIFGAQFHPEKSHKFGMKLLENFNRL